MPFQYDNPFAGGRLLPALALLAATILWGSSFVAMKFAFRELHPLLVIFGRMALAALCFLPFVPSFIRLPLRRHHILPLLAMGLFEPCLYFLLESAALLHTSASQAAMITTLLPLLVALAAGFLLGERISPRTVAGFFIAAAGAIWLSLAGSTTLAAPEPVLGNFLEFLAMVSATGYIILVKHLSRSLPPLFLTAVQCFIGVLFFLPVLFLPRVFSLPPSVPSLRSLLAVAYLGIGVSAGAYGLYNYGTSRLPASQAVVFVNLIPVFTIILGFFILQERLTIWQTVACLVVFAGVLLSQDTRADAAHGPAAGIGGNGSRKPES
ncbi:MAG TPA: DMT family transporter [Desulfobulbus sp.]|nr:DMT family transporter [Desulfobulbus sp.]